MSSKKSVRFVLRPRRQRDPLAADFDAPQNVLVPKDGTDIDKIRKRLPDFAEELFPSKEETKEGMLERAHKNDGVQFDSDILKAMSHDFDYEDPNNILNDDFMEQAGGLIEDEGELKPEELEIDEDYTMGEYMGEDCEDLFPPSDEDEEEKEDRRSEVFTNYSLTSSVMRRNQGLQQIDEHFERLYVKEYADDTEIGPLDLNDVKGEELLTNIDQIRQLKQEVKTVRKQNHGDDYVPEVVSEHYKNAIIGENSAGEEEDLVEVEVQRRENRVDCESILSYNSNLYNHPKLIVEPRRKTASQSTVDQMEIESPARPSSKAQSIASSRATIISKLSVRPNNETPEERRARKKALKEYRQARRQERKQNQNIFKSEHSHLVKQQINNLSALKLS